MQIIRIVVRRERPDAVPAERAAAAWAQALSSESDDGAGHVTVAVCDAELVELVVFVDGGSGAEEVVGRATARAADTAPGWTVDPPATGW